MVEAKEMPSAVVVKLKMYFRVVNTGLPEAVEEVRALWVKEFVVNMEPGKRVESCAVNILEIVEGSVWTRLVHDFVSSVAEEGRVVMIQ